MVDEKKLRCILKSLEVEFQNFKKLKSVSSDGSEAGCDAASNLCRELLTALDNEGYMNHLYKMYCE